MKIKLGSGLLPQNLLVILLIIIIIIVPSNVLHVIIGLPLVLFFPGYSLTLALFPKKDQVGNIERVALSFGLSIAIVPLIGLILNYTPLGITLESNLYSITGCIFATSLIAWFRLARLDESDRFKIRFKLKKIIWTGNKWNKALSVTLVISIFAAVGVLGYVLATAKIGEKFTEFYVLGPGGEAAGYPAEMSAGDEATVILGIVNHEQEEISYRIEIVVDGTKYNELGPIPLENGDKWENEVVFSASRPGNDQKVEFILYKVNQSSAYRSVHFWVDVR